MIMKTANLYHEFESLANLCHEYESMAYLCHISSSGQTEGVLYFMVLAMHILPPTKWREVRAKFLERLLITAHLRGTSQIGAKT